MSAQSSPKKVAKMRQTTLSFAACAMQALWQQRAARVLKSCERELNQIQRRRNKSAQTAPPKMTIKEVHPTNSLMGLPIDVRLIILESLFEGLELGTSPRKYAKSNGKWVEHPFAIFLTCWQLYLEGRKPFIDKTMFKTRVGISHQVSMYEISSPDPIAAAIRRVLGSRIVSNPLSSQIAPVIKRFTLQIKHINIREIYA